MQPTAQLKSWVIVEVPKVGAVVMGRIYNDRVARFGDGQPVQTSLIRRIVPGGGESWHIETLNSLYVVDNHDRHEDQEPLREKREWDIK